MSFCLKAVTTASVEKSSLEYPTNIWMIDRNLFYFGVIVLVSRFLNLFRLNFHLLLLNTLVQGSKCCVFQTMFRTIAVCKKDREVGVFLCIFMSALGRNLWCMYEWNTQTKQFWMSFNAAVKRDVQGDPVDSLWVLLHSYQNG